MQHLDARFELSLEGQAWAVGKNIVFFKGAAYERLQEARMLHRQHLAQMLQGVAFGFQKRLVRMRKRKAAEALKVLQHGLRAIAQRRRDLMKFATIIVDIEREQQEAEQKQRELEKQKLELEEQKRKEEAEAAKKKTRPEGRET